MAQERLMQRNDVHVLELFRNTSNDIVVLRVDGQTIRPIRKKDAGCVANTVRWIIDVTQKDLASRGKAITDRLQHPTQS
ncbi:hypothetical protein RESH_01312 [Rhodopirellula europaea SH398]|uniref:Uncharacterized protein n=1 Tax=Rhodopirellula europaea SH398 TaxID=1263868 RepID=M5S9C8_9BACT|nr:hypothetical protein RESH_01312 [Rhodopirellula europaea SH398]